MTHISKPKISLKRGDKQPSNVYHQYLTAVLRSSISLGPAAMPIHCKCLQSCYIFLYLPVSISPLSFDCHFKISRKLGSICLPFEVWEVVTSNLELYIEKLTHLGITHRQIERSWNYTQTNRWIDRHSGITHSQMERWTDIVELHTIKWIDR